MKGVKLTERIKYLHCQDEDGGAHGILVLIGKAQWPTKTAEIYTQADFKKFYDNFVITENSQEELLHPLKEPVLL
jgi:hypothetical protein